MAVIRAWSPELTDESKAAEVICRPGLSARDIAKDFADEPQHWTGARESLLVNVRLDDGTLHRFDVTREFVFVAKRLCDTSTRELP